MMRINFGDNCALTVPRARLLSLAILGLFATACGGVFGKTYPAYRYRVTVEVETPQGLRRGSSVIEVQTTAGGPYSISGGGGGGIATRVTGEAAPIDLPNGETLFILITAEGNPDWPTNAYALEVPYPSKAEVEERTGAGKWNANAAFDLWMERVEASHGRLPLRRWRIFGASKMSGWPMLVRFKNIRDPASVESVDPDDLEATFGKGYRVRDVYVEKTDDAVNCKIKTRLTWLDPSMGTLAPISRRAHGAEIGRKGQDPAKSLGYLEFSRGSYGRQCI